MASENWSRLQIVGPFENQTKKNPVFKWLAFEWLKAPLSWTVFLRNKFFFYTLNLSA
jgi:hypothetical protein